MATSWIDQVTRLARADARGLLDALDDQALAREHQLRDKELEVLHKRGLLDALEGEASRLEGDVRRIEDSVAELDAHMHIALARDREDEARAVIHRIIPRRRRIAVLRGCIDRIERERCRLGSILLREEAAFAKLCAQTPRPASVDRSIAQPAPGLPGSLLSSGTQTSPRCCWAPASPRRRGEESI